MSTLLPLVAAFVWAGLAAWIFYLVQGIRSFPQKLTDEKEATVKRVLRAYSLLALTGLTVCFVVIAARFYAGVISLVLALSFRPAKSKQRRSRDVACSR
jgi:hypothetical protein